MGTPIHGHGALRMFHQIHPDLVLLDVMLPDQSGIELCKRMRAVLRRDSPTPEPSAEILQVGPVRLDTGRREVTVHGRPAGLSRKEFDLLTLLMSRAGQVVTRESCLDRLWWDQDLADSRTLDSHVKRLRRKIEPDPANPRHLVTIRGVGFRFEP